jgi:hypothetical protein
MAIRVPSFPDLSDDSDDPRQGMTPANEERLQPTWCTQIKGYSTFFVSRSFCGHVQPEIVPHPKVRIKVGGVIGSWAHSPMDKKLRREKEVVVFPDDTWKARELRRRLEQDIYEMPPEWLTWFHGFGWRDPEDTNREKKWKLHEWQEISPVHFYELGDLSTWRDREDALHIEKRQTVGLTLWRPLKRKPVPRKTHLFFDDRESVILNAFVPVPPEDDGVAWQPKLPPTFTMIDHICVPAQRTVFLQSNRRFKGVASKEPFDGITSHLKNAPATWVYPLDRYEIEGGDCENVPTLVDDGCVHTIPHKIDGMNIKQHGLTKWVRRNDKPVVSQEETIIRGKEYKNLHTEEAKQVLLSHTIKSKRNTGGARPESAIESKDDYLQWMIDTGAAQEKSGDESEKEFFERLKELQRNGEPTDHFAKPETRMVWDGESLVLNDDHPEYFEGRVVDPKPPLSAEERKAHFAEHKNLVEAGAVDLREDETMLEIKFEHITREEGAEKLGISVDALDKRIQRRDLEARMLQDGKFQIPFTPLTPEQVADVVNNNAAYLLVDLNEWRWYKLDVGKHGTVDQAIEALKIDKVFEALRQRPEAKAAGKEWFTESKQNQDGSYTVWFNPSYPERNAAFVEIMDRYNKQVFHPDRIRIVQPPPRPKQPWEGLLE